MSQSRFVTPVIGSPGLFFDKLLDVKFTNDNWNIVTYLDISHIQPNLDKVELLFDKLSSFCNSHVSSKIQLDCTNSLESLKNQHSSNLKKFSSISYLLSSSQSHSPRVKRGLIDAGGSLLKTFFGTLDSEDAIKFSDAIDKVQSDEKQLTHLMKDNIHIIKSTISTFNSSMSKVNENEKHLLKNMEIIENVMTLISNSNDKLEIKSQLSLLTNSLESIIVTLSFDIDDINNSILFAKLNVLHPTVLSPHRLYSELDKNRNNLPKHCELPVSLTLQNINELIDISTLISYYHSNRIVIIVKIPLVLPQPYNLFNAIPLPIPYDISNPDTFVLIAPSSPYVAITADRMFYSLIKDLDKCKIISEKCYVCALINVYSTIANPTCETILITDVVSKLPKSCETKLLHGHVDVFHKLNKNRWIFVQSEPGKCHINCNNEPLSQDVILFATGILTLPKSCKAFFKTLQFNPTGETYISNVTNKLSEFNIIVDDCCDRTKLNKTLEKLPFRRLNNIDNLDALLHASIHLDSFENEINKLESPTHFQRYSLHYMSVSYILSIIFFLYLLIKNRSKLCKSNPAQCCIQIFNQCNNQKIEKKPVQNIVLQKPKNDDSCSEIDEPELISSPSPLKRNILFVTKSHKK